MTLAEALRAATERLTGHSESPALDAEVLLCFLLDRPRSYLYTWPDRPLETALQQQFGDLVARRQEGQPVPYLTGQQEFWSLPLQVTPDTLVPRPETELLVELALARLPADARVLDLGTGSGAIALAIASERPAASVTAVDLSAEALAVARANAARLDLKVEFLEGSWLGPVRGRRFDLIAANPPYIGSEEPEPWTGACRFEPRSALIAGDGGLAALREIVARAADYLVPGGHLLLEHGHAQGEAVRRLLVEQGYRDVASHRDLAGHERVSLGRRLGESSDG